jgi:hypothetical protein
MSEAMFGEPVAWALYHDGIPSSTYDRLEVAQKTAAVYGAGWEVVPLYPAPNVAAIDGARRALEDSLKLFSYGVACEQDSYQEAYKRARRTHEQAREIEDRCRAALAALGRTT